jgi:methionyl-tRNA formyltransferase
VYTTSVATPFSIVFCGTPEFAVPSLTALLLDTAFSVKLVITQPDKPVGRKQVITPTPVKVLAEEHQIPVLQAEDINGEIAAIREAAPDILIVVAFGQILSEELLLVPRLAAVNLHPSLLPRWRGASPVHHTILAGDREAGITIQKMAEALDAGPILAQERLVIPPTETSSHLLDVLAERGAALLVKTLKDPLHPVPQDESKVTFCQKLTRRDGETDPVRMTAEEIDRKVRALTPWPGVTAPIHGETVKLLRTSLAEDREAMLLPCAKNSTLYILSLQPLGGKPMSGAAWLHGHNTTP